MSARRLFAGRRWALLAGAAMLAGVSGAVLAQNGPQSLLPPGFDKPVEPAPKPTPRPSAAPAPTPSASASRPAAAGTAPAAGATTAVPVVQPVPGAQAGAVADGVEDDKLLDTIDPDLLEKLVESTQPKYDIPPRQQRSLAVIGPMAQSDGGFPALSTYYLNGAWVKTLLERTKGPLVSRWGEILLRRALVSRLATPVGMNGADWAAERAQLLLRLGEADAARLMVEQVDSGSYTPALEDAAMSSFLATADPVGLCPITALTARDRPGWQWDLSRDVCSAFTGDGPPAMSRLDKAMRAGKSDKIDILLAQKFAGAAAKARRAVTIEWDDVDSLTPWRFGYAVATGVEPPADLMDKAPPTYRLYASLSPVLPLDARAGFADHAAGRGILSASAMVDLYSQIYATGQNDSDPEKLAEQLHTAYVAPDENKRMAAIRAIWGRGGDSVEAYSRRVLTAYAAARMKPDDALAGEAGGLIGSMLTAGLDRNAARWAPFVSRGSDGWAMLTLASPDLRQPVGSNGLDAFHDDDSSSGRFRSKLLLAGLMGLQRVDGGTADAFAKRLEVNMNRATRWTRAIDSAAASGNQTLVTLLAAFGMQGSGWDKMTPVYLYHIVSALHRVGLDGEARMIAAEAIART
ncbi:hypothetical protein RXV95_07430 [Novosphingobium sp. ZN18A2]|uniref:hypothetical protein n=1 Tax=Novosphingobium sp. ZN18A2 TaxID=3079861 RepID=UPI0030CA7067